MEWVVARDAAQEIAKQPETKHTGRGVAACQENFIYKAGMGARLCISQVSGVFILVL
jgi:hypothetical protein